jgi:hypothetical protein
MIMHNCSDGVTRSGDAVFKRTFQKNSMNSAPIQYVTPSSGADGIISGYKMCTGHKEGVDDAITHVQMEDLYPPMEAFMTPRKRKASKVSNSIKLLDSE